MTFQLNSRCLDVLRLLLASDEPLAAARIAAQLSISPRMVRSSLVSAAPWLRARSITLKSIPGQGLVLLGTRDAKKKLARTLRAAGHPSLWLSRSERLYVVLLTLFFASTPQQVKQLQESLNLSRTTTLKVIDEAQWWLAQHHLSLLRRQNCGALITGDERAWRNALVELLCESAGDARILALLQGSDTVVDGASPVSSGLEQALQQAWTRLDLEPIKNAVASLHLEHSYARSDQIFMQVMLHIAVIIYRMRLGHVLPASARRSSWPTTISEFAAAIHKHVGVTLPESEIGWLVSQLPENEPAPGAGELVSALDLAGRSWVRMMIRRILADASLALHPSLGTDTDLGHNLGVRLQAMLAPSRPGDALGDPLLQDIKRQYPYVFSTAQQSSGPIAEALGRDLTPAEVGEIAACLIAAMERLRLSDHPRRKVLVVCSAGTVTAWLLVSRLRAEFPDVEVVDAISARELESRRNLDGIDFIVSTIPLKVRNIPSRQVTPLLGVADCRKLKALFETRTEAPARDEAPSSPSIHLCDLLTAHTIELGVTALTWPEVVEKAGSRMLRQGIIEGRFIQAMQQVIREHGPYMVIWPGVALLHAPPHGVRQLGMQLITLRTPVPFGHPHNDPVQAAIVLAATDTHSHITALLELNRLLQDDAARLAICTTTQKPVILHWVNQYSK